MKVRKKAILKLFLCFALTFALVGAAFSWLENKKTVQAATVDVSKSLDVIDATPSWTHGSDEVVFIIRVTPHSSVAGNWNSSSHTSLKSANGNLDILQYICINGEDARTASTNNQNSVTNHKGESGWLANGGKYAPVYVEVVADQGVVVRIDTDYSTTNFEFTVKAGFALLNAEGDTCVVTEDVVYNYNNGELAVASSTVAMDDKISIGTWGEPESEPGITWMHVAFNGFSVAGADWHIADGKIDNNNGVDPLEYVIINGETARSHYVANNSSLTAMTATGWVEAFVVKVSKDYLDLGEFTFQLKAGFTFVGADGKVYALQNDTAIYGWDNGNFGVVAEHIIPSEPEVIEGVDYIEYIGLEDRSSWASGGNPEVASFGVMDYSVTEGNKYFRTFTPVGQNATCWYRGNTTAIEQNNGVDIMQYIYINNESARDALNANTENKSGSHGWLTNPAAWPIAVETVGDFWIRLDTTYFGESFTLTFKAGFSIIKEDGVVITLSKDVEFAYENGVITKTIVSGEVEPEEPEEPVGPEIPAGAIDITATLEMEDRTSWGAHAGEVYVGMLNEGSYFNTSINGTWHADTKSIITSNGGVDIMQFILVNGVSARELITANYNGDKLGNSCSCWLSNPAAYPVYVETTADSGLMIRLATAEFGTEFTITFKAGFVITDVNGNVVALYKDVEFAYNNGTITKTVEGEVEPDEPEIPDEPEEPTIPEGAIDITETITMEDRTSWGAHEGEIYVALLNENSYFNTAVNGAWYAKNNDIIAANGGFDIMKYILVNGVSARELILNNYDGDKLANSCSCWLSNPAAYPVYVETTEGSGLMIKLAAAHVGTEFTVTLKAGFVITDVNGNVVALYKDVEFAYDNGAITKSIDGEVVEIEVVEMDGKIGITSWGTSSAPGYVWINMPIDEFKVASNKWQNASSSQIAANNGVDPLEYTYINGVSARELYNQNEDLLKADTCTEWQEAYYLRINESYLGVGEFTVQLKAGFTLVGIDGKAYVLQNDTAVYGWNDGIWGALDAYTLTFTDEEGNAMGSKVVYAGQPIGEMPEIPEVAEMASRWTIDGEPVYSSTRYNYGEAVVAVVDYCQKYYTVSFEGVDFTDITVEIWSPMANLPEIPAKEGYLAYWTIDGEEVDSTTVYNYDENKVVVANYIKIVDIKDILLAEDWGSPAGMDDLTYIRVGIERDSSGNLVMSTAFTNLFWNDGIEAKAASNYGCDLLSYIYINGVSARELVTANANGNSQYVGVTFPFNYGVEYAPICLVTTGNEVFIWVLKDYAAHGEFTVTFKAGFTLRASDEKATMYVLSEDVEFYFGTVGEDVRFGRDFTVSFEGFEEEKELFFGDALGQLPEIPARAGYSAVWTIDGVEISEDTLFGYNRNVTAEIAYTAIEYTITINRANGDVETLKFTDLNKEEVLASIKLTESNLFYSYSWQEALPDALDFTNYTFVELSAEQPASTRIISYSLTIGVEFTMNVYVEVVGEAPMMKFVMGDREMLVSGTVVDAAIGKYVYKFAGIEAYNLAEDFTATLILDGSEIDSVVYSVEEYLIKLANSNIDNSLKALIADIIEYAQAAEECEEKETGIQDIDGLVATEYSDLTKSDSKKTESTDSSVAITRALVNYEDSLTISVIFRASKDNVTVLVDGVAVDFVAVEEGSEIYVLTIEDIYMTNVGFKHTVEIYVGEAKVQTLVYSVNSYLYEIQGSEDSMSKLLKAAYNLSVSAKAYSEGE